MTVTNSTRELLDNHQFVRCVLLSQAEKTFLRDEANCRDYFFVEVDLAATHSSKDLMMRMAKALDFPSYFGGNWDAFLDMVTDLSWKPASGYVVLLKDAEALLKLPSEQLAIFVQLCSVAAERWQSGEDEEGKTIRRTPFYLFLEGQAPFCRLIVDLLTSGERA